MLQSVNSSEFREQQLTDETLQQCWIESRKPNTEFHKDETSQLLYRHTVIGGFEIKQLVVPKEQRDSVISLAHDSLWAMHFAHKKTYHRVRAYFYWPKMSNGIKEYVKSCAACQKHLRRTKRDKIPIKPVTRADVAFQHVNVDIIGPLSPKSSRGHEYVLCLIDSCTRWPEAVPLKTLTAKETCDALLSMFCRIGCPRTITTDNGSGFTAAVTSKLQEKLGLEVRRSTPYHPEGNSLVERWNASLKQMIHHLVLSDSPRDWDKKLEFLLWAYREVPNETTGMSPYQLVYGRLGRGPLAILKDSWSSNQPK